LGVGLDTGPPLSVGCQYVLGGCIVWYTPLVCEGLSVSEWVFCVDHDDRKRLTICFTQGDSHEILGMTARQRSTFSRTVMQHGFNSGWVESVHRTHNLRRKRPLDVQAYGLLFCQHLCEEESTDKCYLDGTPREGGSRQDFLQRIGLMYLIHRKVLAYFPGRASVETLVTQAVVCSRLLHSHHS
jgi:hypothetical protein